MDINLKGGRLAIPGDEGIASGINLAGGTLTTPAKPTARERLAGAGLSVASGAMRAAKAPADLVSTLAPNDVTRGISDFFQTGIDAARDVAPESIKRERENQILSRGVDGGIDFNMPTATQVIDVLAESAPMIPGMLLGGGALAKGAQALGAGRGAAQAIGYGGANAAFVAPSAGDESRREALAAGLSEENAREAELTAAGLMTPIAAATGAAGLGLAAKLGQGRGVTSGAMRGFAADAPFEGIEEGAESVVQDVAAQRSIDPLRAGSAAILGTVAGGLPGAAVGALEGRSAGKLPIVDPLAAREAKRQQSIGDLATVAAVNPNAGPLSRTVGLNPDAAIAAGAPSILGESVEPSPGKAKSLDSEFKSLQRDQENSKRLGESLDSLNAATRESTAKAEAEAAIYRPTGPAITSPPLKLPVAQEIARQRAVQGVQAEIVPHPKRPDAFMVRNLDGRPSPQPSAVPIRGIEVSEGENAEVDDDRPSTDGIEVGDGKAQAVTLKQGGEPPDALSDASKGIQVGELPLPKKPIELKSGKEIPNGEVRTPQVAPASNGRPGNQAVGGARAAQADRQPPTGRTGGDAGLPASGVREAVHMGTAESVSAPALTERVDKKKTAEWEPFEKESGTLGIPRADMPQIKAEHRGALVNFLSGRGIKHTQEEADPKSLKPTQAEYSPAKVEKAKAYTGGDRSIIVSSDGHVIDGHHQWVARLQDGKPMRVIRLGAKAQEAIDAVREFPSVEQADGATQISEYTVESEAAPEEGAATNRAGQASTTPAADAAPTTADVLRADGKPFPNKLAAGAARAKAGQKETHDIVPVESGFVLRAKNVTENPEREETGVEKKKNQQIAPNGNVGEENAGSPQADSESSNSVVAESATAVQPKAEAAHLDGTDAERVTDEVVTDALDDAKGDREKARDDLIAKVMAAAATAPKRADAFKAAGAEGKIPPKGMKWATHILEGVGFLRFKVPGDGTFKILNTQENLAAFAKQVKSSSGFSDRKLRDTLPPKRAFGMTDADRAAVEEARKAGEAEAVAAATPARAASPPLDTQDNFVPAPDGGLDYGEITPEIAVALGRQAGKIRLRRGDEKSGLAHIKTRHEAQILNLGFKSVEEFISKIAREFDAIYKREGRSLDVVLDASNRGKLIVQLEPSAAGDYYDIITATPIRSDQYKNKKPVWERAGPSAPSAKADPLDPGGQTSSQKTTPAAEGSATAKNSANTEDSGKELWYNRRSTLGKGLGWDEIKGLNAALKVKEVTKTKVWPRPDYQQLVDNGLNPVLAHIIKQVYDGINSKPDARGRVPEDHQLEGYMKYVAAIRDATFDWAKAAQENPKLQEVLDQLGSHTSDLRESDYNAVLGETREAAGNNRYTVKHGLLSAFLKATNNDITYARETADRLEGLLRPGYRAARDAKEAIADGWPSSKESWERQGYQIHEQQNIRLEVKAGRNSAHAVSGYLSSKFFHQWFDSVEEAQTFLDDLKAKPFVVTAKNGDIIGAADAREAAAEIARAAVKKTAKKNYEEEAVPLKDVKREGAPRRAPDENVSSDRLKDAFGFTGVNFGNWMKGDTPAKRAERQAHLNHAYDAFADLAELFQVPPKAMGLNGILGLAFGAQGRGGKGGGAAHFVPGVNEINLTREHGAGAIAHEWGHALDHYFAVQAGEAYAKSGEPYITALAGRLAREKPAGIRPEMVSAFAAIDAAMNTRVETAAEFEARIKGARFKDMTRVAQWAAHLRKQLEAIPNPFKRDPALRDFDLLTEQMKRGDAGDGYVKIGRGQFDAIRQVTAQVRALFQDATGRSPAPQDLRGLDNAVSHLAYQFKNAEAAVNHEPQRVSSTYARNARLLDGDKGGAKYWSTPWEKFARAFQSYAMDKLAEASARNDYLTRPQFSAETAEDLKKRNLMAGDWYPRAQERKDINTAMDALVQSIKTRETEKGVVMFSLDAPLSGEAMSFDQVELTVKNLLAKWDNAPPVVVLRSMTDPQAPQIARDTYAAQQRAGAKGAPRGFIYKGVVYVVADTQQSPKRVVETVFHEALGHYGLRGVFGKELVGVLRQVVTMRKAQVDAKIKQYGFHDTEAERLRAAEEVLAEMAESRPELGFVQRAIAAIRSFLRKLGMNLMLTDKDIIANFLIPARRFAEQGVQAERESAGGAGAKNADFAISPASAFSNSGTRPNDYVLWNGSRDLAMIPQEAETKTRGEVQSLPVRLHVGRHFGKNRGFGLVHIEAEHGSQIREKGLTVEQFVAGILDGAAKIYAGDGTRLTIHNERSPYGNAYVELRNDGGYYSVVTAFSEQRPRGKLVWSGRNGIFSTQGSEPSVSKGASATTGQSVNPSAQNVGGGAKPNPTTEALAGQTSSVSVPQKPTISNAEQDDTLDFKLGDAAPAIRQRVGEFLDTKRTFNDWWHKTVGTQYHKAQVDKDYGRVFNRGQEYLTDVSRLALGAADAAPDILPRFESLKDLAKSGASPRELKPVADAIFRGTLEDEKTYTDDELRTRYLLNPKQIRLYRQARAAIEISLEDTAITEMVRLVRSDISESVARNASAASTMRAARDILANAIEGNESLIAQLDQRVGRVEQLKDKGYAPLMRFGRYSVYVTGEQGEQLYYGMFEDEADAKRTEREMREQYPKANIQRGVVSEESYKMFRGITPDTAELFADVAGFSENEAVQQYLKITVNNRSALKRLIQRKGIEGYNPDLKRVLAQFITSNARVGSGNLHQGEMLKAWEAIPKEKGDVKDEAARLIGYVREPQEEAQRLRSFLFFNFLGGSVASAAVNMTQPVMMSFPYLSQWGAGRAAAELGKAVKAVNLSSITDPALRAAMDRAIKSGVVEPHQIFELQGAAMNAGADWGPADKAREALNKATFVWGRLFSWAEQFNRRLTFAAAFQIGRRLDAAALEKAGVKDAYEFAIKAINETQGVYNRGNRPDWARGAVGATLFTFKQFRISYLEFLKRLPRKQQMLSIGVMVMAAGMNGLPGIDDLDDLIDTLMQALGYSWNSKEERQRLISGAVAPILGEGAVDFVQNGVSAFLPIDIQGRLGMGNLLPGTGIGLRSQENKGREIVEAIGPAGALVEDIGTGIAYAAQAARAVSGGDLASAGAAVGSAFKEAGPVALQNLAKAIEMSEYGFYLDTKGRRVIDTDAADAAFKSIGFQPNEVARESRAVQIQNQNIQLGKVVESEIADVWAQGIFEKNPEKVERARNQLMDWNSKNPKRKIHIVPNQIQRRVKEMQTTRAQRFIKRAPTELRAATADALR